jgi:hypothetical protein
MPRPETEDDFLQELRERGTTRDALQKAAAAMLGIDQSQVGALENADVLVGGPWPTTLRGSTRARCASCAAYVSLAPSSQRAMAARPIRVVCIRCAKKESENHA